MPKDEGSNPEYSIAISIYTEDKDKLVDVVQTFTNIMAGFALGGLRAVMSVGVIEDIETEELEVTDGGEPDGEVG